MHLLLHDARVSMTTDSYALDLKKFTWSKLGQLYFCFTINAFARLKNKLYVHARLYFTLLHVL